MIFMNVVDNVIDVANDVINDVQLTDLYDDVV